MFIKFCCFLTINFSFSFLIQMSFLVQHVFFLSKNETIDISKFGHYNFRIEAALKF